MEEAWPLFVLLLAAVIGIAVTMAIIRRQGTPRDDAASEPTLAIGVDDLKACPACGAANLVKDETCLSCGEPFPA